MIRVHVLLGLYPQGDGSTHRRTALGIDLSLVPERVDTIQAVTKVFREAWKLPPSSRAVLRYDSPVTGGYRLYVLSDSRDAVERAMAAYRRYVAGGGVSDVDVPDHLPDNL